MNSGCPKTGANIEELLAGNSRFPSAGEGSVHNQRTERIHQILPPIRERIPPACSKGSRFDLHSCTPRPPDRFHIQRDSQTGFNSIE